MVVAGNKVDEESITNMEQLLDSKVDSELSDKMKEASEEISSLETEQPYPLNTNYENEKEEKHFSGNHLSSVSDQPPSLVNRQLIPCHNTTTTEIISAQLSSSNEGRAKEWQNSEESSSIMNQESAVGNIGFSSQCPDRKKSNERILSQNQHKKPPNVHKDIEGPSLQEVAFFSLTCPLSILFSSTMEERCILPNACLLPYQFPCSREHTTSWQPPVNTKLYLMVSTMSKTKHESHYKEIAETVHCPSSKQITKETFILECFNIYATNKISLTGTKQPVCNALMYHSSPTKPPNTDSWYRPWKITFSVKLQIIIGERRLSTHEIYVNATLHQLLQVTALYHQNDLTNCTLIFQGLDRVFLLCDATIGSYSLHMQK